MEGGGLEEPRQGDTSGKRPAIAVRGLGREYRLGQESVTAVGDVSFEIQAGEFVALLGRSGSGKSTLLNIIAGLDRPTSGGVTVNGRELAQMSSQQLASYRRETVGMVFQSFNLISTMTLEQNVELPMRFAEVERGERATRVTEALRQVHVEHRRTHRPNELSGGEQQRCAIARALVNRPRILLADEPTGNLDSRTGEDILQLINEINGRLGMTVVMVTHEQALAERFAKRMIFLGDGRVIDERSAEETRR